MAENDGQQADDQQDDQGGDGGQQTDWQAEAEKWKRLSRENEKRAKANADAASELEKVRESAKSEAEKAVDAARKEGETAAATRYQQERVLDRIEILAAKTFADPEDARLRLQGRVADLVGGDGTPDVKAIQGELDRLLKDRPHLAATPTRTAGDIGQGARGDRPDATDMNQLILRASGRG